MPDLKPGDNRGSHSGARAKREPGIPRRNWINNIQIPDPVLRTGPE
jgi:hypothetical protein